jgi:hypothetical protein
LCFYCLLNMTFNYKIIGLQNLNFVIIICPKQN